MWCNARIQLYYKYRVGYKLFLIDVTASNVDENISGAEKSKSKILDYLMPTVRIYYPRKLSF